jgi:threonine dehydratase
MAAGNPSIERNSPARSFSRTRPAIFGLPKRKILADSLAPKQVGQLMYPIAKRYVDRVILVSDAAILKAQKTLWSTLRIVAEPGGNTSAVDFA